MINISLNSGQWVLKVAVTNAVLSPNSVTIVIASIANERKCLGEPVNDSAKYVLSELLLVFRSPSMISSSATSNS